MSAAAPSNWMDRLVEALSPAKGLQRQQYRRALASLRGYEASEPSRKRRFHTNQLSGDALARWAAMPLRNQARHLERNHDIARGILDKLVDFSVGAEGITVEPQPRTLRGDIHDGIAEELERAYAQWSEWPEVTWTHSRGSMERLAARSWFRDGEVLGQQIGGYRDDLTYGSRVPYAIQMMEADHLPIDQGDNLGTNLRQGIERDHWGRPRVYHLYRQHPGEEIGRAFSFDTVPVSAELILHPRHVDRIGQLRGVSVFAPVITRLQDLFEYEDSERIAAKMAASLVLKLTRGDASMWDPNRGYDPDKPPIYQMDGGMTVVNTAAGENAEFFDTKRPYSGVGPFVSEQLRRVSGGVGLSYSAVARDYNGTYSAQRQELVENWPHYHALTGTWVAQWSRPSYQNFVRWWALTRRGALPADLDLGSLSDAIYLGPPMPWIDPEKETNAQIMQVQAAFKSSAQVMRERNTSLRDTYRQIESEVALRRTRGISSTVDVPAVNNTPAQPSAPEAPPAAAPGSAHLRVVK